MVSSAEENTEEVNNNTPYGRKRKNAICRREEVKKARVQGLPYKNYAGKEIPRRINLIHCRCTKQCLSKLPENCAEDIYSRFCSYGTKDDQDAYLQALISCEPVKRKRSRGDGVLNKPKSFTFSYRLSTPKGEFNVCKNGFMNVHGITEGRTKRLVRLLVQGKCPTDMRGKNTSGNTIDGTVIDLIMEHIKSFPVKMTHYSDRDSFYLDEKLNMLIMYDMFVKKYPTTSVKYLFYRKIFKEKFSLRFGRPQVDTCCQCEELNMKIKSSTLNNNAKRVAVAEKIVHQRRAKKFYKKIDEIKRLCQEKDNVCGISMDFMQNIQLPQIPVQETFYLRQLTYNIFSIFNFKTNESVFFGYHEGIAKKGPNEITSFINWYIENYLAPNITELYIFSDNCSGQNKNNTFIRYCLALVETNRFEKIKHVFPQRGHSFLPNDRTFAYVKRVLRRHDRLYLPMEITELMVKASTKNNFHVKMVSTEEIIDYQKWWPKYYKKNTLSLESLGKKVAKSEKSAFQLSKYSHFIYNQENVGVVRVNKNIDGVVYEHFRLKSSVRSVMLPSNPAYSGKIPINIEKMKDIKKLARFLNNDAVKFYKRIFKWPTSTKND